MFSSVAMMFSLSLYAGMITDSDRSAALPLGGAEGTAYSIPPSLMLQFLPRHRRPTSRAAWWPVHYTRPANRAGQYTYRVRVDPTKPDTSPACTTGPLICGSD